MRINWKLLAILGILCSVGATEANAQWGRGPFGRWNRNRRWGYDVYASPVVVTSRPYRVRETRVLYTAPIVTREVIQPAPVVERRIIQPAPIIERRVIQPAPIIERRVIQPPPIVERRVIQRPPIEVDRVVQPLPY